MMKWLHAHLPSLNWQTFAAVGAVVVGLLVCGVPVGLLTGGAALLIVAACLLPCLIPFTLRSRAPVGADLCVRPPFPPPDPL